MRRRYWTGNLPDFRVEGSTIARGPDGNVWFAATETRRVGKISTSGEVTEFAAGPTGFFLSIASGPDGNIWVGSLGGSLARVTPAGVVTRFGQNLSVQGITGGPDGNVWFSEGFSHSIGRITPGGAITLFPTPSSTSFPRGMTTGSDGKIYFVEGSFERPALGR